MLARLGERSTVKVKKQPSKGSKTADEAGEPRKSSALVYWGAPVVLGVLVGGGAVLAYKHVPKLFQSDAQRIVDQWKWANYEHNDGLVEQLSTDGGGRVGRRRSCW